MEHPLHRLVGDALLELRASVPDAIVILSPECGGGQHIPLFSSHSHSHATKYCNVDAAIVLGKRLRVIIEIEESDVKPTQICGKFLTSALSCGLRHREMGGEMIPLDDNAVFVQVLDTCGLNLERTSKPEQWDNLRQSIQTLLASKVSKINRYAMFYGAISDFKVGATRRSELVRDLQTACNTVL